MTRLAEVSMWLWMVLACQPSADGPDSPTPTEPTTVTGTPPVTPNSPTLTVTGGYGGGTFAAGAPVHVWADVDPQTELVVGWSGDVDLLETSSEWNAAGTMPDHDATLAFTVEGVPHAAERRSYDLDGRTRDVLVVEAPAAKAAVLFFHGAAYAIDQLEDNAASTIVMHLVRGRYTVVAVQSEAEASSGTGGWSASLDEATNTDLQNVAALVEDLRADGTIGADTPLVAWGMSSGGNFAHAVGAVGQVDAVVASCAPGSDEANAQTQAHTAWYLAAEDGTFPTAPADAEGYRANLITRGLATDLYVHPTTPLYDQRFERVAGIDAAKSAEIAESLRASGAYADGAWTASGGSIAAGLSVPGLAGEQLTAVKAEIEILAADHELYDDVAARMVAFLDGALE